MSDDGYMQSDDDRQQYDELHILEDEMLQYADDQQQSFAFMSSRDTTDDDIVF